MDGQYHIKQVKITWLEGMGDDFHHTSEVQQGGSIKPLGINRCRAAVYGCAVCIIAKTWWPTDVWRGSLVLQRPLVQRRYIGIEIVNPVRVPFLKTWALARGWTYLGRGMHFLCTEYYLPISHVSTEQRAPTGGFFSNSSTQMGHLMHTGHIQA